MRRAVCALLAALLLFTLPAAAPADNTEGSRRIELAPSMLTDENIYKYHDVSIIRKAEVLVNEQDKLPQTPQKAPLPLADNAVWKPVFGPDVPEAVCHIDLGAYYFVTDILLYDSFGSPTLTVERGEPFCWQPIASVALNQFNAWRRVELDAAQSTRYIRLSVPQTDSGLAEIGLYGILDSTRQAENFRQPEGAGGAVTMDRAFGVCAFVDDPIQVSRVAGTIREFHNLSFTYQNGQNYFSPSVNGAWDFDAYYKELYDKGIDAVPCVQGTTRDLSGDSEDFTGNEKPIPPGVDPADPASYRQHASALFNYAARYGALEVARSRLSLAPGQTAKSGLGYLKYYENFNEGNKDWEGRKSYFSPYEFAAMCSADYDGHEGRLGEDYGIKSADPASRLVMGGLVGRNVIDYLDGMKFWFEHNRTDKRFAVDVVNLHRYVTTGVPEDTSFQSEMQQLKAWVAENLPGTQIWITEFGPEIPESEIADPKSAKYLEAKGNATVRQFLLGMAAGLDRMTMFMLRDTSWGVYANDGLVTEKGRWETKPSWHYVYGARTALSGTVFDEAVRSDAGAYVYRFRDAVNPSRVVYAVWRPVMDDSVTRDVPLNAMGRRTAMVTRLEHGYAEGVTERVPISGGAVRVDASARPVFVTLYEKENVRLAPTRQRIPIRSISGDTTLLGRVAVMFDEQEKTPKTATLRVEAEFTDYEKDEDYLSKYPNLPELNRYPATAVIDFGAEYVVTDVGFYDAYNTGNIVLYAMDSGGGWRRILGYNLNNFMFWKVLETETRVKTRFLLVEKYNSATCYEMALYGYPVSA